MVDTPVNSHFGSEVTHSLASFQWVFILFDSVQSVEAQITRRLGGWALE